MKIDNVSSDKVKITISSDPITFEMNMSELKKIDLDSNGYYDLEVLFESYSSYRGIFVLTLIEEKYEEEVIIEEIEEEVESEVIEEIEEEENKNYLKWIIVVVVLIVGFVAWKKGLFEGFSIVALRNKLFGESKYHDTFRAD